MARNMPLKLIEIPAVGKARRFYAKAPDGMSMAQALALANAVIKRANQLHATDMSVHDSGAVYNSIVQDLAIAGFAVEDKVQVKISHPWDSSGALTPAETNLLAELDKKIGQAESCSAT